MIRPDHEHTTKLMNGAILALVSLIGIAGFLYPFFQPRADPIANGGEASSPAGMAHTQDAPVIFVALIVLSLGAVLGNMVSSGLNSKMIAALGLLTAVNAVLRALPGPAGFSAVFALPILAGYCYGPTFGYLLGALSLAVSALLGAGVGPWLPFQMLIAGWVGLTSGWLPSMRRHPRIEVVALSGWGAAWGLAFGVAMNLWFWPLVYDPSQAGIYWQPGAGMLEALKRYAAFYAVTSSWWDVGRAVGNAALISLFGRPVLRLLRRFGSRFAFQRLASRS